MDRNYPKKKGEKLSFLKAGCIVQGGRSILRTASVLIGKKPVIHRKKRRAVDRDGKGQQENGEKVFQKKREPHVGFVL